MFVYQPSFNTIKYKKKRAKYVIGWKSRWVYSSKLIALNSDFLSNIKYYHKKGLQFNNTLFVEQNNYITEF